MKYFLKLQFIAIALLAIATPAMSYWLPNTLYGYKSQPYAYQPYNYKAYTPQVDGRADDDFHQLEKIQTKATPIGENAMSYVTALLPANGPVVESGAVKTQYGNIPIQHRMSKAERQTIIPVAEALLAVLKQDKLNDKDVEKLLVLSRDLATKIPKGYNMFGDMEFDF